MTVIDDAQREAFVAFIRERFIIRADSIHGDARSGARAKLYLTKRTCRDEHQPSIFAYESRTSVPRTPPSEAELGRRLAEILGLFLKEAKTAMAREP